VPLAYGRGWIVRRGWPADTDDAPQFIEPLPTALAPTVLKPGELRDGLRAILRDAHAGERGGDEIAEAVRRLGVSRHGG
jgi:hypothetical protein